MQTYIIKSFKNLGNNLIYSKDNNTGFYIHGNISSMGLMDFMCNSRYKIYSIIDNSNTESQTLTIGDVVTKDNRHYTIFNFKIEKGKIFIETSANIGGENITLQGTIKYIEPVAVVEQETKTKRKYIKKADKFNELEKVIISQFPRVIRLENLLKTKASTLGLQGFLIKFFKEWNNDKRTIFKDDSSQQTPEGRRRSLGDVYMICKYYFPEITLKEVIEQLYIELPRIITRGYRSCKCGQIHKRVWYYQESENNAYNNTSDQDEYSNTREWYLNNLS